jgi:hypothetical protein
VPPNKRGSVQRSRERRRCRSAKTAWSRWRVGMEGREARLCRFARMRMSLLSLGNDATMAWRPVGRSLVENSKARIAGKWKREGESVQMLPMRSALGVISVFLCFC